MVIGVIRLCFAERDEENRIQHDGDAEADGCGAVERAGAAVIKCKNKADECK